MKNEIMKRKKKGFTLVEIIVVLVILAVLAAVTIPSMLGFVDEARGKTEIANARAAYLACQMIATERHAMGDGNTEVAAAIKDTDIGNGTSALDRKLGTDMNGASVTGVATYGIVTQVTFVNDGWQVVLADLNTENGTTTVTATT